MNKILVVGLLLSIFSFVSCVKVPEMTLAEMDILWDEAKQLERNK